MHEFKAASSFIWKQLIVLTNLSGIVAGGESCFGAKTISSPNNGIKPYSHRKKAINCGLHTTARLIVASEDHMKSYSMCQNIILHSHGLTWSFERLQPSPKHANTLVTQFGQ
jgi:hypothetical protein